MKYTYITLLGLLFFLVSCGDNVIEEPDENLYGYEYFPLGVGYTWEYQMDSIVFGGGSNVVTTSFIQEKITELLSESGANKSYRIERRFKRNVADEWKLIDVWQVAVDGEKATKTEENLKFVKLVFPATKGKRWDGNLFFDSTKEYSVASNFLTIYLDWRYKIEDVDISRTFNDIDYSSTMHVSHIDDESAVSKRFSEEFYAKDIGLVERSMEIYGTQDVDTTKAWIDRATEGYQMSQKLISFTKN